MTDIVRDWVMTPHIMNSRTTSTALREKLMIKKSEIAMQFKIHVTL
jgi:hypothetical protein